MPVPATKRFISKSIGTYYKNNKVPRKNRTKYSRLKATELINLAERIGAIPQNKYRAYRNKGNAAALRGSQPRRRRAPQPRQRAPQRKAARRKKGLFIPKRKIEVDIGVNDFANRGRVTEDIEKWGKNPRYWDMEGIDTEMSMVDLKFVAKNRGITGFSRLNKKQLISAIARTERVRK